MRKIQTDLEYFTAADAAVANALEGRNSLMWISKSQQARVHNYIMKHLHTITSQLPGATASREGDVYLIGYKKSHGIVRVAYAEGAIQGMRYNLIAFDELGSISDGALQALEVA